MVEGVGFWVFTLVTQEVMTLNEPLGAEASPLVGGGRSIVGGS